MSTTPLSSSRLGIFVFSFVSCSSALAIRMSAVVTMMMMGKKGKNGTVNGLIEGAPPMSCAK